MTDSEKSIELIIEKLQSLEMRIAGIEAKLNVKGIPGVDIPVKKPLIESEEVVLPRQSAKDSESLFESNLVEYGLAWFGSIVLLFGVIFLVTYLRTLGYSVIASGVGYIAAGSVFIVSYLLRKPFPHLVFVLNFSGYLLIYYITLRLHFFSATPLIAQKEMALALLTAVIGAHLYFAIRNKSEFMAGIGIILMLLTAAFLDSTYVTLTIIALTTVTSVLLFARYSWWRLLLMSLFLIYVSHLLWLLSNPIMGHPMRAVQEHQHNLIFLFFYVTVFATTIIIPTRKSIPDNAYVVIAFWNAFIFSFVLLLIVLRFYGENYVWIFELISASCLLYSVVLKYRTKRKFAPAFYACVGFVALSVTVYGYLKLPDSYLFLTLESLLVVSMALWFRSRLIVVVNTFLYLGILIFYLITSPSIDSINFTFAIVALATARILNWKKERLTLMTDLLRNMYLLAAFFMILYSLGKAAPSQYVTLTWTAAAIGYFVLSILLTNIKYRWMAIATLMVAGIRLFVVDLANLSVGYRVIAFLFFAIISVSLSIYYTKRIKKRNQ